MALLKNKKNTSVVKDIKDENLVSMYLATNEWEIVETIKTTIPKHIEEIKDKRVK